MLLRVRQGKGRKDRVRILSETALEQLRRYYKLYHPEKWLFEAFIFRRGTDLRYIQELLGHSSSKTTEVYTHVSKKSSGKIQSPLDKVLNKINKDLYFIGSPILNRKKANIR